MEKKEKNSWMTNSLLLPGCMFTGMGLGMFFNATQIGLFIGMGIGFMAMGVIKIMKRDESGQNN